MYSASRLPAPHHLCSRGDVERPSEEVYIREPGLWNLASPLALLRELLVLALALALASSQMSHNMHRHRALRMDKELHM